MLSELKRVLGETDSSFATTGRESSEKIHTYFEQSRISDIDGVGTTHDARVCCEPYGAGLRAF